MTTYFPFQPRPRAPFVFTPVLDGTARRAEVRWSLFGRRWFLNLYALTGARIVTLPVVGSGDPLSVASAAWDGTRQRVEVATAVPHGFVVGTVVALTFRGFAPATYNGAGVLCTVLDPATVAYDAPDDPGAATTVGSAASEVDLAGGYFASTLVYRTSATRFEVDP